jgi:proton-dependent oligopeptide transporter, POT family
MSDQTGTGNNAPKSFIDVVRDSFKELAVTAKAFVKSPRALWGINIPYIIEGLVYFGILTILGKFCSENVVLSDIHSGWVYGGVTGGITFAMLLFGGVSDKIGVRLSLGLSLAIMMVGRGLVALSGTLPLGTGVGSPMFFMMISGLFLAVIAYGLYQPAAYAGVKRYTNPQTAAVAYAAIYGLMNLGAFVFGFVSPPIRHTFEAIMPPNGLSAVFWFCTIMTLISVLITFLMITKKVDRDAVEKVTRETLEMNKNSTAPKAEEKPQAAQGKKLGFADNILFVFLLLVAIASLASLIWTKAKHIEVMPQYLSWSILVISAVWGIWEFLRKRPDHPFRDIRFVFFIFMLIPVQTLFAHQWLTIPYYTDRAFVGTAVSKYFEFFSNLNPIIIFVLAPIVAGLTARANVYKMMIIGTTVMALPTFLLTVGPNAYLLILYIVLMSVGEAMWQPRFLQWVAEIAPEGKTGAYMGIGQFPWFLTKMITASYSGYFISKYVPKPDSGLTGHSEVMWLIYACIAMVSPVVLILARKWMMKGMKQKA